MTESYWLHTVKSDPLEPFEALPRGADVIVIGAGYAGLAAARTLARRGATVIVLDQGGPGSGASGRNGGIVAPGPSGAYSATIERWGRPAARLLNTISEDAVAYLRQLAEEESYDVELHLPGHLVMATTDQEIQALKTSQQLMTEDGWPCDWIDMTTLPEGFQRCYVAGLKLSGGFVHSGKLSMAMAHQARVAGARIGGPIRVIGLTPGNPKPEVILDNGQRLIAEQVVVATNAWTASLVPGMPIVAQRGQVLVTDPVPPCLPYAVGARQGFDYFHQRQDGRIVLGGGRDRDFVAEATSEDSLNTSLQAYLEDLLAQLLGRPIPIAERWSGIMGFTPDYLPLVGEVASKIHMVAGFSGHGVVVAPILGQWLGESLASGNTIDALSTFSPSRFQNVSEGTILQ